MNNEADHCQTFENLTVAFTDKSHLTSAGFYYTNWGDVVLCEICGAELVYWQRGDGPFKDHQRWSPSFVFMNPSVWGHLTPSSYCDVGRFFYAVFKC